MKIFVAGSGKDRHWVSAVIELLQMMGHKVYNWANQSDWDTGVEDREVIAIKDIEALSVCDVALWIVSNDFSRGSNFEAGFCLGANIPMFVWEQNGEDRNHIYPSLFEQVHSLPDFLRQASLMLAEKENKTKSHQVYKRFVEQHFTPSVFDGEDYAV